MGRSKQYSVPRNVETNQFQPLKTEFFVSQIIWNCKERAKRQSQTRHKLRCHWTWIFLYQKWRRHRLSIRTCLSFPCTLIRCCIFVEHRGASYFIRSFPPSPRSQNFSAGPIKNIQPIKRMRLSLLLCALSLLRNLRRHGRKPPTTGRMFTFRIREYAYAYTSTSSPPRFLSFFRFSSYILSTQKKCSKKREARAVE